MTVSYSQSCFNNGLGTFARLLFRWRGSIYKIVYKEAAIFVLLYYSISLTYWYALNDAQKATFRQVVGFFKNGTNLLPITFVLGGFVSFVVSDRWWAIFSNVGWPDRRTIVRYLVLAQAVVFRCISEPVLKRLPTLDHLRLGGLMTFEECEKYKEIVDAHKDPEIAMYSVPVHWACTMLHRARKDNLIDNDIALTAVLQEISNYRSTLGTLWGYDWITVPLVYTQVVTVAVYTFFLSCLVARQHVDDVASDPVWLELFFPLFTFLQFLFYMGWLKVAEVLVNPLGCDDDDFEINYILERNIKVAYTIVDKNYDILPNLVKDKYWYERTTAIPNTQASKGVKSRGFRGSVADVKIPLRKQTVVGYYGDRQIQEPDEDHSKLPSGLSVPAETSFQSKLRETNMLRRLSKAHEIIIEEDE